MNTKIRMLIVITLTWTAFAILGYLILTQLTTYTLPTYISTVILFTLICWQLAYALLKKKTKKLEKIIAGNEKTSLENLQLKASLDNEQQQTSALKADNLKLQQEYSKHTSKNVQADNIPPDHIHYDSITSLPNRIFFNAVINKSISYAKRNKHILAVLLIEVELGNIDPSLHNELLKEIGNKFSKTLRSEDVIAKLDGNEFVVLLTDINKSKFASTVAEKLLQARSDPFIIKNQYCHVTAHIGISIYPSDGQTLEDLLKNADSALYKASSLQKANSYEFYTEAMSAEARAYIQIENDLRNAIKNNELVLYYQPQLNLRKGRTSGIETLLRWEHPEHGLILPNKFIGVAEETGLIMQIGEWVINEACRISKYWQVEGYEHVTVSVNLSPKQLHHPNLFNILTTALNKHQLNPKFLELELTEKTVMDDADTVADILNKIKTTGVQISIDHFGTGYISISHLKKLPISTIKIDHSFIQGIPNNPNDLAITSAFIGLAHNLGLEAVAEGVETEDQVHFLSEQNCDMIQGYFLSHPLPAQKIILQLPKLRDETLF